MRSIDETVVIQEIRVRISPRELIRHIDRLHVERWILLPRRDVHVESYRLHALQQVEALRPNNWILSEWILQQLFLLLLEGIAIAKPSFMSWRSRRSFRAG